MSHTQYSLTIHLSPLARKNLAALLEDHLRLAAGATTLFARADTLVTLLQSRHVRSIYLSDSDLSPRPSTHKAP
jgi:hypothetical protein